MKKLSIIVPAYNEEETVGLFYDAFSKVELQMDVEPEIIFVDDGSKDNTLIELKKLQKEHEEVHYISFSRNFGKEAALYAGLQKATGDFVAVMDVDLQDPPELLPKMLKIVEEGEYDAVATRRQDRDGESKIRSFFARMFYKWINKVSSLELVDGARDFRVMTRQMVDSVLSMDERERFSKGLFNWVGFNTYYISYENRERVAGSTSWSFWGLLKYAIEGFISFSTAPLSSVTSAGVLTCALAVLGAIVVVIRAILFPHTAAFGWPSLAVIILFFSGVQLLSLGIIGRYIAEIYLETKNRPIYIIKEEK
ncbi:glycosyltransferase [Lactiplantibacillus plantarum]|mgnify:FL=1|uniref:glycosyltransferase family 2 protein n=1 Tax=Lactiplantibacillus plantarum TaxID=1590 RepID=UPI000977BC43|nr:glycosyltransferase family 2 protein [Lactiplantibacillus plantarum]MCM2587577.1 glycosyltransferase [Lactiplantibacillus plantarum]MCM2599820.1 glycosyltransferase [Lactiplantibacillus plantarum]MCM2602868.1 glycosyltransferase [Lactiplantibacillus plantarum]MCM2610357.1 glycosyltransferase [Lactiplantibacillus plantarum]MCM2613582.1 glycosyltransferase [Lactiplantibacillus plantarum]